MLCITISFIPHSLLNPTTSYVSIYSAMSSWLCVVSLWIRSRRWKVSPCKPTNWRWMLSQRSNGACPYLQKQDAEQDKTPRLGKFSIGASCFSGKRMAKRTFFRHKHRADTHLSTFCLSLSTTIGTTTRNETFNFVIKQQE